MLLLENVCEQKWWRVRFVYCNMWTAWKYEICYIHIYNLYMCYKMFVVTTPKIQNIERAKGELNLNAQSDKKIGGSPHRESWNQFFSCCNINSGMITCRIIFTEEQVVYQTSKGGDEKCLLQAQQNFLWTHRKAEWILLPSHVAPPSPSSSYLPWPEV